MPLGANRWGKSAVRVSKILPDDEFVDIEVQLLLEGDVEPAHTEGDNRHVLPTDTMRNTIYGMAQQELTTDLERFGVALCEKVLANSFVEQASVTIVGNSWDRVSDTGYLGGSSVRRVARVARGNVDSSGAGVEGLVVLKTRGSAFEGFPRDEFTILPDAADRLLATSVTADWVYTTLPADTTGAWQSVRDTLVERFMSDWSASVQHQGYLMGESVLAVVPEISEISFRLPNQHHLPYDLTRFGMDWDGSTFHPVSEPFGDIYLTVTR